MAIAFDAATTGSDTSGSSYTFAHTVSASSNRFLFVVVTGNVVASPDNVTGITYAGVAMTLLDKSNGSGDRWQYIFYLIAPAVGANNVVISSSGAPNNLYGPGAFSYIGVKQAAPEVSQKTTGTSTSKTETITTLTNNAWVIGCLHCNAAQAAGSGTTFRAGYLGYDKNAAVSPAGAATMALTWTGTVAWAYIMCSIAPFPDSGSQAVAISPLLMFMQQWKWEGCLWRPKGLLNGI
jgi:hypothetical protein